MRVAIIFSQLDIVCLNALVNAAVLSILHLNLLPGREAAHQSPVIGAWCFIIYSDSSSTPPIILQGGGVKKYEIWPRFAAQLAN